MKKERQKENRRLPFFGLLIGLVVCGLFLTGRKAERNKEIEDDYYLC